jgi:hypothetical protein
MKKEKGMKPILVNFGLALAISFAGYICSRLRITTIKHSSNSPTSGLLSFQFHHEIQLSKSFFFCFVKCLVSIMEQPELILDVYN